MVQLFWKYLLVQFNSYIRLVRFTCDSWLQNVIQVLHSDICATVQVKRAREKGIHLPCYLLPLSPAIIISLKQRDLKMIGCNLREGKEAGWLRWAWFLFAGD